MAPFEQSTKAPATSKVAPAPSDAGKDCCLPSGSVDCCLPTMGGWCGESAPDPHLRSCAETREEANHQVGVAYTRILHRWNRPTLITAAACLLGTVALFLTWIIYTSTY